MTWFLTGTLRTALWLTPLWHHRSTWERPRCPFCSVISVLRSAFLFSCLSQIPTSLLYFSRSTTPHCSPVSPPHYPSPLPDLYLEFQRHFSLAVEQTSVRKWPIKKPSSAPPPAPQVVSSLWGRHSEQGQECAWVKGLVGREGLCLERLGMRRKGFKARQSWDHRGQPSTPVFPSLPVLNC